MTAVIDSQYTGDGVTTIFSIGFPYIDQLDVQVYVDDVLQTLDTDYILANNTSVSFYTAPADGTDVFIKRVTSSDNLKFTFFPGSAIRARDLNDNFTQTLYVSQESTILTNEAEDSAIAAQNSADASATSAAAAAASADQAISVANTASASANTAITTANSAVSTANTAVTNSNSAVTTANQAASDAETALNAVAGALSYTLITNVASIPVSPDDQEAIEVTNTTGIEVFTPLSGLPTGFNGDSGLFVRMVYSSPDNSWIYVQYGATDPDSRYGVWTNDEVEGATYPSDATYSVGIGTSVPQRPLHVDGIVRIDGGNQLELFNNDNSSSASIHSSTTSDPATLNLETGGSTRLHVANNGNVGINETSPSQTLEVNGGVMVSKDGLDTFTKDGLYLGHVASDLYAITALAQGSLFSTLTFQTTAVDSSTAEERMRITQAGRVGIGTTTPDSALHVAGLSPQLTIENVDDNTANRFSRANFSFEGTIGGSVAFIRPSGGTASDVKLSLRLGGDTTTEEIVSVLPTGEVGIGVATPTEALDVAGTVRATGFDLSQLPALT